MEVSSTIKPRYYILAYFLLLLLVVSDRILILHHFAFQYTDHDQTLMWYSAKEFLHNRFHEPCFYGQNYNTMIEGLFAVPFIAVGLPYPYALPLITSFLALLPYLLISGICLRLKKYINALLILLIPLMLPIAYGMITSLSRGFVTGIAIASVACVCCFFSRKRFAWILFGMLGTLALWVNGNSSLIVFPTAVFLFLKHGKNILFYFLFIAGILPTAIWIYYAHMFYVLHPGYIFYNPIDYSFSFKLLTESSKKLDLFFNDVIPLFWKNGWLILPILSIQSLILLLQKNAKGAAGLLGGLILIIISLGISKVHEGNLNIFYPLSRMYLGIPVLSALFIPQIQIRYNSFWWIVLLNVGIAVFVFKNRHPDQSIRQKLSIENDVMSFYKVSEVDESCMQLREIAQLHNVSLIISLGKLYDEMFGCTCLYDDFPETLVNYHERRTWRFEEEEQAVRTNILLVGNYLTENSISLLNHNPNVQKLNSPSWYNVYLISNNKLPTLKLLQTFEIGFRKYK